MAQAEQIPLQSSVIILRIQDYPRRPVAEQARLRAQLDTLLALLLPDIPQNSRIVMSGNGNAAVAILDNPPVALAFAERALNANQAGLNLGLGIDHGPVEVVQGNNLDSSSNDAALSGDGLATASIMAAAASEVGLLVSQNFRTALAQAKPGAEYALVQSDNFSDAGLRTYQVYALDRLAPPKRRRHYSIVALSIFVLLMVASVAMRLSYADRPRPLAHFFTTIVETVTTKPVYMSADSQDNTPTPPAAGKPLTPQTLAKPATTRHMVKPKTHKRVTKPAKRKHTSNTHNGN
ncbi:MAG: hypothetical protein ACOH1I_06455 [Gallionellaceae bacterium]